MYQTKNQNKTTETSISQQPKIGRVKNQVQLGGHKNSITFVFETPHTIQYNIFLDSLNLKLFT